MDPAPEYVVLVDETDQALGTCPKAEVHGAHTPLHRAFSLFIFNRDKRLLLQQRALDKPTWPGVWSNSCCGHPLPGESYESAAVRRTRYELGLDPGHVQKIADYRYCFTRDGVMENEICPIYAGFIDEAPRNVPYRPDEVAAVRWIPWRDWLFEVTHFPHSYSPWCVEETLIMDKAQGWKSRVRLPASA